MQRPNFVLTLNKVKEYLPKYYSDEGTQRIE